MVAVERKTALKPLMFEHTDLVKLLTQVTRVHVDNPDSWPHHPAIYHCADKGWITIRQHFAEKFPQGVNAYEITDTGLEVLEEYGGTDAALEALDDRTFYRTNTSQEAWAAQNIAKLVTAEGEKKA